MSTKTAIPPGSLVLVTGANGYVASHICDRLLKAGYKVRGTVRSADKAALLTEVLEARYPKDAFHFVVVPDMAKSDAFEEAMKGVAGVVHVATNASMSPDQAVIKEVLDSVHSILNTAAKHQSVKRFVYTSSGAAQIVPVLDKEYHIDVNTWNDPVVEMAKTMPDNPYKGMVVYSASKTLGERACFEFAKTEKPGFVINTVLPYFVIGPILHPKERGSTAAMVKSMFEGVEAMAEQVKIVCENGTWIVDVRDVADFHLAALNDEDLQGERLIACGDKATFNDFLDCMEPIPGAKKNLPARIEPNSQNLGVVENKKSEEVLKKINGKGFISLQDAVRANCLSEWTSAQ